MKKLNKLFILLVSLFLFSVEVNAAKNPYKETLSWGGYNCTWFTWQKVYDETGVALAGFGNAKDWYRDAERKGYTVGSEPRAKAVVVWDNYLNYGHVGYVERVEGDNIYVWDTNTCYADPSEEDSKNFNECIKSPEPGFTACENKFLKKEKIPCVYPGKVGDDNLVGYIYTDIPRKTSTSSNSNTKKPSTNTTTPKKEEKSKSSNNNLSSLTIANISFDFNKDVLEYNIDVPNEIETIEVSATQEDSKAKIEGTGNFNLNVGINTFKVTVTAENNSKKEYVLNIKRLEKETPPVVEENQEKEEKSPVKEDNKSIKWYFWIIPGILVVGIISIIFIVKKNNKTK